MEISPALAQIQIEKLSGAKLTDEQKNKIMEGYNIGHSGKLNESDELGNSSKHFYKCTTKYGTEAYWYKILNDVPSNNSLYVAHEFFDALPVCKFQVRDN